MKMPMDDIKSTYTYYVNAMRTAHTDMAYIHVVESRIAGNTDITKPVGEDLDFIYDLWTPRTFLVAGGFNAENGPVEAETRKNSVVVYGRWFISNPDLVSRIKNNVPLAAFDRATFYVYGPQNTAGYTDYPIAASA
jgi:NADPH2 dehydrogenase